MCGIFGYVSSSKVLMPDFNKLAYHSRQRGRDSSGLLYYDNHHDCYHVVRADFDIKKLLKKQELSNCSILMGHSRLITNGLKDNQPVIRGDIAVIHNGIIVNDKQLWESLGLQRRYEIDSEIIAAITEQHILDGLPLDTLVEKILKLCKGVVACALTIRKLGKLLLFSNNGSLYIGNKGNDILFASESFPLSECGCVDIRQIKNPEIIEIPTVEEDFQIENYNNRRTDLIPGLILDSSESSMLENNVPNLVRCSKCILPETMPFITFDKEGVCNYCKNYKLRNKPKSKEELFSLVEPYRRKIGNDCIVPFSGGRDSCYGLHLIVNELKMKPVTYTYDWGMVTDLGRRNISRMSAKLGVENIIIADDIEKKRRNIAMNLKAWLKSPNLGMLSILTAGDKHFFRYVEDIKRQTGININLWGVNPLEVTHFKSGFLGVKPDFEEDKVYSSGIMKQLRYQWLRFNAMLKSFGYFNSSLWDTLSGEYYRSFTKKEDYFHIFDYWRWDEDVINDTLISHYDWETAVDTKTTWRIGDGTAAFYNYVYYTVAGFTEHDTFRSNQIREGQITREKALSAVLDENMPRYANIRWYLDTLGMDFKEVIKVVNSIPKLYEQEEQDYYKV